MIAPIPKPDDETLDFILRRFSYDPATGILYRFYVKEVIWRECCEFNELPRLFVKVLYKNYSYATLCWFVFYKEWPTLIVDHKDQNPLNNKLDNLRLATIAQNASNVDVKKTNQFHGVLFIPGRNKWRYHFRYRGKRYNNSTFNTELEAVQAREAHLNALGDTFCKRNKL